MNSQVRDVQNANRLGLNFILDTKNDPKPPINPYNICCTYKNARTTLLEVKKVKGGSRGSGKGESRSNLDLKK